MKTAYLGLGSNLGEREANLAEARTRLVCDRLTVTRASSIWETEPREMTDQPWFLNQVVEIETSLFPRQLFHRAKRIEREMGRKPGKPKGPRLIDIDILIYGDAIVTAPELEIPHARLPERRFVLQPLAELAPALRHPANGQTIHELLQTVAGQAVRRWEPS